MSKLSWIAKFCIVIFASLLTFNAEAKSNFGNTASLLNQVDAKSAVFILNLMKYKEKFIDDDKFFNSAKKLLPVTVKKYTLEDMSKDNGILYLKFTTNDENIPILWKENQEKYLQEFTDRLCKIFKKGRIKTVNQVNASVYYNGDLLTEQSQKASDCK